MILKNIVQIHRKAQKVNKKCSTFGNLKAANSKEAGLVTNIITHLV